MKLKRIVIVALCLLAVLGASTYAVLLTRTTANANLAMVELRVENMTCGSCVGTITDSLTGMSGVESVDVSVTTGIGKVTFDPQLVSADKLAETVTGVGFPATVKQLLNSEQYQLLQTEETRLAANYVARIAGQLISRVEFDQQILQQLKTAGLQDRPETRSQAIPQAWQTIVQRTLLLQEADKNQVVVQNGEVDLRMTKVQKGMPNFDEYIQTRYGSKENFQRQLKEEMIISRNIEQFVIGSEQDRLERQQTFNRWFQGLMDNAAIVIYDQQLKQASSSAGGCGSGSGGSCCG